MSESTTGSPWFDARYARSTVNHCLSNFERPEVIGTERYTCICLMTKDISKSNVWFLFFLFFFFSLFNVHFDVGNCIDSLRKMHLRILVY